LAISGIRYPAGLNSQAVLWHTNVTSTQLPNYLLANRKRLALFQEDVGFLLGTNTGELVCRHERFARQPSLEEALAYEATYHRPVRELFPGLYQKIEREVAARAEKRSEQAHLQKPTRQRARRMETLREIVIRLSRESQTL
jgi:hypothetical protein